MALIRIGFFSETLGMCTSCDVVLPQQTDADAPAREFPVMYLLHNLTKSHSTWQRMTCIERYALSHGVAVVMPDAQLSSYADMLHGGKFFTYIADELPEIMRGFFPISAKREETFICGSSMGGYGALKIGLSRPERFGVIGSLSSGYTSYRGYISRVDDRGLSLQYLTFGETGLDEEDVETAEKARDFFSSFEGNPFDFEYTEHPGSHSWSFWDAHICDFLRYAGLNPRERYC